MIKTEKINKRIYFLDLNSVYNTNIEEIYSLNRLDEVVLFYRKDVNKINLYTMSKFAKIGVKITYVEVIESDFSGFENQIILFLGMKVADDRNKEHEYILSGTSNSYIPIVMSLKSLGFNISLSQSYKLKDIINFDKEDIITEKLKSIEKKVHTKKIENKPTVKTQTKQSVKTKTKQKVEDKKKKKLSIKSNQREFDKKLNSLIERKLVPDSKKVQLWTAMVKTDNKMNLNKAISKVLKHDKAHIVYREMLEVLTFNE